MGRSLPQEWIDGTLHTLNVVRDLGGKGNIPNTSLSVVRQKPSANSRKTKNLQWRFLPEKADDPRPFAGKTNRGREKRIYIEGTCGTTDPWENEPLGKGHTLDSDVFGTYCKHTKKNQFMGEKYPRLRARFGIWLDASFCAAFNFGKCCFHLGGYNIGSCHDSIWHTTHGVRIRFDRHLGSISLFNSNCNLVV